MSRILITGGAGFVGCSLAEALAENAEHEIVIVDDLTTGKADNLPNRANVTFVEADVNDYQAMKAVFVDGFDYVYHYAAVVGVERTLQNPLSVLEDIEGFKNILSLCRDTGVKRILYASSSEVYGEPTVLPQHEETTPLNARLPYAVVKNIGECYVRSYKQEHDLDYTIFRFFNTYGPKQSTDFVMSRFINAALNNEDITVYGDGSQKRTFCYIDDNLEATIKAMNSDEMKNQVLNVGNSIETSILELAQKVIERTGSTSNIVHLPPLKEGDMKRRQPDNNKMKQFIQRDLTDLNEGLGKVINYLQSERQ